MLTSGGEMMQHHGCWPIQSSRIVLCAREKQGCCFNETPFSLLSACKSTSRLDCSSCPATALLTFGLCGWTATRNTHRGLFTSHTRSTLYLSVRDLCLDLTTCAPTQQAYPLLSPMVNTNKESYLWYRASCSSG